MKQLLDEYQEAVFDTDKGRALRVVDDALARGVAPETVVFEIALPVIEREMERAAHDPDANLARHFMTAQISAEVTERLVARFAKSAAAAGRVVIGNSRGDVHSLGKRIVIGCLKALMIEVYDLGANVAPDRFVDEAVAREAQVIAISSMMVHTARGENGSRKVRQLLRERGLEARIKIAVGGAPYRFNPTLWEQVGADGWARDGISAGRAILDLIAKSRAA